MAKEHGLRVSSLYGRLGRAPKGPEVVANEGMPGDVVGPVDPGLEHGPPDPIGRHGAKLSTQA